MVAALHSAKFDPHEQGDVQERAKNAREHQKRLDVALGAIMSNRDGRALIWSWLERCGVFRISFQSGAADQTAFNEGQRNVGLSMIGDLGRVCPDHFATMQTENAGV